MAKRLYQDGAIPGELGELEQLITEMREKSPVTEGKCAVCGAEGKLLSGVCETCFVPWAREAALSKMRWRK
ncbi:MAG: hypothetical protein JRC90_11070 [Deltaproteobacteria bacterium]|nr:hypothetical protein [Deltaproteobacteria bacterium]